MKLKPHQDAIGQAMYDQWEHGNSYELVELVERDDGFISHGAGPGKYFAPYRDWAACEKRVIRHAQGRVIDIGCGAGRHAVYLQERGHDVLGIDVSPLALKVARLRGLRKTRALAVTQATRRLGIFDTILMLGNNFGLMGNRTRARWLLRRFKSITPPEGRIIASTNDLYQTDAKEHLAYQRNNRRRGRMSGQIRCRIRHRQYATPYFDFLMVSLKEMNGIVEGTGWAITRHYEGPGSLYAVVLEKSTS